MQNRDAEATRPLQGRETGVASADLPVLVLLMSGGRRQDESGSRQEERTSR